MGRSVVEATVSEVDSDVMLVAESVVVSMPLVVSVVMPESVSECDVVLVSAVLSDELLIVGSPHEQSRVHMQSNIRNIAFFIEIPSLCKLYGIFILSV